ncbi:MAG: hypothetical protein AB1469_08475 [Pseudomonadota bacterium]
MNLQPIKEFFAKTPKLAELCSQNGWPDPESLNVAVVDERPADAAGNSEALCSVTFDEVVMEGSGCEAGRVSCWGRYRLKLDRQGNVRDAALEAGSTAQH